MKTKCPHCGAQESQYSTAARKHFACGSYVITKPGFSPNRSDKCLDLELIDDLTEERDAWKKAAVLLSSHAPSSIEHGAVAFYKETVEKYGI